MVTVNRSQMQRYGVAVLAVVLALLLMLLLNPWVAMTKSPFLMFFGAVMVSAWYGGMGPGLLATFLSAVLSTYFFVAPTYSLTLDLTNGVRLGLFVLEQIMISALCGALHSANRRLKTSLLKLRSSEERYRRIIDTAYEGIWTTNAQGRIEYVNKQMAEMLGYRVEEMLDCHVFNFMDEVVGNKQAWKFEQHKQGIREQFDLRFCRKDGSFVWTIVSTNPILSETGEFLGTLAMITDVSDRKQAEDALRRSEERFRRLFDSNMIGIAFWSMDGLITDANDAYLRLAGYTREEFTELGKLNWRSLTPSEYKHLDDQAIKETLASGVSKVYEKEYIHRDGKRVPIVLGVALLNDCQYNGVAFVLDITDRKQAEAAIHQINESLEQGVKERTAQLEALNKELESFSHSVSHDLRAPLRHISGFADLLQKRAGATLDETSLRYLNTIGQTTQHAGTLIDNLLAFSRMGRSQMRYTTINMAQLIREVQRDIEPDTNGRTIRWQIKELPQVQGDPSMLRLALSNLMENAVKYTQTRVQAEIEIGSTENEHEFIFFVRDNGVGFDMRYIHKLFGVFQRLHSMQEFDGTGIGLANVQRIIHRHGGKTWAEGVVDGGATFYFSLPKLVQKELKVES